ncbi:MAG: protein kinase [Myxococcales bacterium]|nr:protein kinase [Myxococcales bacterium]
MVSRSIPAPATVLFEPGFRFDGYELLVKIGQGGMASVWLARTRNSRDEEVLVAIKTVLPELAVVDELRTMMLDEARVATAIESPNVARVLKVGEVWDIPYLVLEYVAGESVDQLCDAVAKQGGVVPPAIAVRVLVETCKGLAAAHDLRSPSGELLEIVHRDLSPQNVLLDERGHAKLIDFGIAKARERITPETAEGVMKGKIPYMAPEHAMGGDVDRRSDLWSLGAVAYRMLTGTEPYDASNDAARLIRKLSKEPLPPWPASVPSPLAEVVTKVLSHSPDDRYPDAPTLAAALEAAVPPATFEEVAAFVREALGETIHMRHVLVERAVSAANARARARDMLSNPDMAPYVEAKIPSIVPLADPSPSPRIAPSLPPGAGDAAPASPLRVYGGAAVVALAVVVAYALGARTGGPVQVEADVATLAAPSASTSAPGTATGPAATAVTATTADTKPADTKPAPTEDASPTRPTADTDAGAKPRPPEGPLLRPTATPQGRPDGSTAAPEETIF